MKDFEKIKERIMELDQGLKDGKKDEVKVLVVETIVAFEKICHNRVESTLRVGGG